MAHRALAHKSTDDVAVAVSDLKAGEELTIQAIDGGKAHKLTVLEAVPLGHKVALKDMPEGHILIEYGEKVGRMTKAVKKGGYVHVHNLRTLRWDYGMGSGKRAAGGKKVQTGKAAKPASAGAGKTRKGGK